MDLKVDEVELKKIFSRISDILIEDFDEVNYVTQLAGLAMIACNIAMAMEVTKKIPNCKENFIHIFLTLYDKFENNSQIKDCVANYTSKRSHSMDSPKDVKKGSV